MYRMIYRTSLQQLFTPKGPEGLCTGRRTRCERPNPCRPNQKPSRRIRMRACHKYDGAIPCHGGGAQGLRTCQTGDDTTIRANMTLDWGARSTRGP